MAMASTPGNGPRPNEKTKIIAYTGSGTAGQTIDQA
jgi:hypothetical protein